MVSPGGYRKRATPVPIPNTEVKPLIADGTAWVTVWESRTLPGLGIITINKKGHEIHGLFYFYLFNISASVFPLSGSDFFL